MIFNSTPFFGRIWKTFPNEKYIDIQMTTGEKNQDGEYTNSSWRARLIGHAFNSLKDILKDCKEGTKIKVTKSKFTNIRKQDENEQWHSFFNFIILEAEIDNGEPLNSQQNAAAPAVDMEDKPKDESADYPW